MRAPWSYSVRRDPTGKILQKNVSTWIRTAEELKKALDDSGLWNGTRRVTQLQNDISEMKALADPGILSTPITTLMEKYSLSYPRAKRVLAQARRQATPAQRRKAQREKRLQRVLGTLERTEKRYRGLIPSLENKTPATEISFRYRISVQRVYQIRDLLAERDLFREENTRE